MPSVNDKGQSNKYPFKLIEEMCVGGFMYIYFSKEKNLILPSGWFIFIRDIKYTIVKVYIYVLCLHD
jgi:hypothetical protein